MMRSAKFLPGCAYVALIVIALSTRNCLASPSESNSTQVNVEEEDEESQSDITLAEFKERYRRLIPYMTFYVANNYVNSQASAPQSNSKDISSSPLVRKNPQYPLTRFVNIPRRGGNYRVNLQNQEKKFVPSVQYDPSNIGGDNEYFTPVRYSSKLNYDDYSTSYQLYQGQKATYGEITTPSSQIAHKENRYFTNVRPLRPYATNGRDHLPRKQLTKPVHGGTQEDYVLDYNARPSGNVAVNYPVKDFQGHRYIPQTAYSTAQHPIKILESIQGRQPSTILQPHRNPNVNLHQIIESFQLSERLPEILNQDNFDKSLKMLVEILDILHNSKKEEFPQIQPPPLTKLIPAPTPPRFLQKIPNYDNLKLRPQTRPKVVTETRFQATPNPLFVTDDPERFEQTYVDDERPTGASPSNYNTNSLSTNKLAEYYTPFGQNIPGENKQVYESPNKPQVDTGSTEHSYEITEDLQDDILQEERFSFPSTTESTTHSYVEPNEIVPLKKMNVPLSPLKYGVTRGKPNVDYPAYAKIPETDFSCKEQRYKGFFGDPATGCQVWHYCDLNGGKSSFLCPNGTIFSQVALTCDWWFNVKCETTTQLYVLNERLYKYILPIMPKFPEDFTGPEVDRYLELKFKEMEAKMKEKKLKKQQEEKEKHKNKLQSSNEDE